MIADPHYPLGVTAGSAVFDTTDVEERYCPTCENDTDHTVTEHGNVNLYVCTVCGDQCDEDMSEPDPDEAHDREREGW